MQLTGKQIVDRGIITNYCEAGVQQQGLDCRIDEVFVVEGVTGYVPAEGKTKTPKTYPVHPSDNKFYLAPGYYEVNLMEACNIPNNIALHYHTRSSLVRCGAMVTSGQFDGGFHTDKMGCYMQVFKPITIEKGARIAQAICTETYEVDDEHMYNGQFQNDQQRV